MDKQTPDGEGHLVCLLYPHIPYIAYQTRFIYILYLASTLWKSVIRKVKDFQ